MRIAVWYNLPSGGAKRALHDHLVGLKALGHEVELWRPPIQHQEYLDLSQIAVEHEIPFEFEERDSSFYPLKIHHWSRRVDRLAEAMTAHSIKCAEEISRGGFDILFANTDVIFHAPFIGRYSNLPRLLYLQEPNRPLFEAQPRLIWLPPRDAAVGSFLHRLRKAGRTYIDTRTARRLATEEVENAFHYDRILVNSRYSRESVLRAYGVNSHVCYLGIDPGLFENLHRERKPIVINVGSFFPPKNPRLIIEGIGRISADIRPPLVWAYNYGDSAFLAEMQALARSLNVDFQPMNMVSDSQLVELLNQATAFVYAPRLEPFGLAPLEANACATPVVAVAEGGLRETIEDGVNGILVEHDPDALAEGVRSLLEDPSLARKLGETGERYALQKWSVSAAAKRLEKHLLETARPTA